MTPDTVVELVDVVKEYPGSPPLRVLHGMSLAIESGELVAVVGASGSGKSTMLSIMGTLDDPTSGTVLIDGTDAAALAERERAVLRARRIGFVFQQFFLLPALSAVDNVALGLLYSGVSAAERSVRAAAALERVGLGARMKHRPGQLSGGEQQRVAIARAIVGNPSVLFADEPTGALDSTTGERILELLTSIADSGTAVVIITHDPHIAERTQRQVSIHDGRIVSDTGSLEKEEVAA
ncbi:MULTISPECIES: ABC transporter ATP-binding protein [unclassified Microbacterium]|uniref:ABC transporter ATP-binding protein n=1 Tax=unclassified Microbacterium TaxID=2609290 RepID=UPI000CFD9BF5|nr:MULTISPECIES: ABC transporter ATP-binding protein [unclassified Microbacterium]PQZ55624.1 ABC transporter ATP-binding protein [Microbacterium sp. MYb43]PQZ80956.1 ABC transporter ATP-binding protein [Microbacterium sp. MYb40]PRB20788.1 ABC transporter ATP-binding protein [Microbacterium sp. MYb54]PRB31849.1 ABC transporter ATP-binding protein [Microbacterium sp. MYb50]PRB64535.1 ABC transporter ATP-binding protein [Microbacterium sp. MYb24]